MNVEFDSTGLISAIKQKAVEAAEKLVREKAATMQNVLQREFRNDLKFGGLGQYANDLMGLTVEVVKTSDQDFTLTIDMKALDQKHRELAEFYFQNAKSYVFG